MGSGATLAPEPRRQRDQQLSGSRRRKIRNRSRRAWWRAAP